MFDTEIPQHLSPPDYAYTVPELAPDMTFGAIVVGMSQAGKTTLLDVMKAELTRMHPDGEAPPAFPLSNGFRGATMHMLEQAGVDLATSDFLEPNKSADIAQAYAEKHGEDEVVERIFGYYREPPKNDLLRNNAVNSAVPHLSENPILHPLVVMAAGRYLRYLVDTERPRAFVIDGRSHTEMAGLMDAGGITLGGLFVVTCSAAFSVRRRMPEGTPERVIKREIKQQRARNRSDRGRNDPALGPTTMPKDLRHVYPLDRVGDPDSLFECGRKVAGSRTSGILVSTEKGRVSRDDEPRLVPHVLRGMVAVTR